MSSEPSFGDSAIPATTARSAWPARLVAAVVLANVMLVMLTGVALQQSRKLYQQRAETTTLNLARLFEQNIRGGFDRIDHSLKLLAVRLPQALKRREVDEVQAALAAHLAVLPDIKSLAVIDSAGELVAATNLAPGASIKVKGRETFDRVRQGSADAPVISPPMTSVVDGQQVVIVARRLDGPQGEFLGVVSSALTLQYFQRLFADVDIGERGAISLRDLQGGLIARRPAPETSGLSVGDQNLPDQAHGALQASPRQGTFATPGRPADPVPRTVSYLRVEGYPFYVFIGLASEDFLAGWHGELRKAMAMATLFAFVTISLSMLLARSLRRREAEMAALLNQAEQGRERFARLFRGTPIATLIMSMQDRRLVDVNEAFCRRYGVTRDQVVGKPPAEVGIGPTEEFRRPFWQQLAQHGHIRNFIAKVRIAGGEIRESVINGELIDYQGERCALATSVDITELREAERAREAQLVAEAANRAKTEFLSRMSHELRTPLNAVIGFSQLLRDEAAAQLTTSQQAQLEHIHQAGWYLLKLTNDVLDISRIEAGQFQIDLRPLSLASVLDEPLRLSRTLARRHEVTLGPVPESAGTLVVRADPLRLQQVMLNLLSNAIKYNRSGGTVLLEAASEPDGEVRIEIIDDGQGMNAEQLQRLFEPFNRLGRERSGIEGAGIGLTLTRQLVRLMHGRIEVDSEPDRGTRVRMWLPGAAVAPHPEWTLPHATDDATDPVTAPPQGSVLYIEDNSVNALLVEHLLSRWPAVRCALAADGGTGLELARSMQPDVVLLDMQLPDMNGLEVLRRLREDPQTRSLRIVALSANAMAHDVARTLEAGADDYWTKPIDPAGFLADMQRLLPARHLLTPSEAPLGRNETQEP